MRCCVTNKLVWVACVFSVTLWLQDAEAEYTTERSISVRPEVPRIEPNRLSEAADVGGSHQLRTDLQTQGADSIEAQQHESEALEANSNPEGLGETAAIGLGGLSRGSFKPLCTQNASSLSLWDPSLKYPDAPTHADDLSCPTGFGGKVQNYLYRNTDCGYKLWIQRIYCVCQKATSTPNKLAAARIGEPTPNLLRLQH